MSSFVTGSIKSNINAPRQKCSGNVEVYFDGRWSPVCEKALDNTQTQNTICGELECGRAVKRLEYFGTAVSRQFISELECQANGNKTLGGCRITADENKCVLGGLQCSGT